MQPPELGARAEESQSLAVGDAHGRSVRRRDALGGADHRAVSRSTCARIRAAQHHLVTTRASRRRARREARRAARLAEILADPHEECVFGHDGLARVDVARGDEADAPPRDLSLGHGAGAQHGQVGGPRRAMGPRHR